MINEDNTILMNEQTQNTVANEQPAAQSTTEQQPEAQPKKTGVSRAAMIASTAFAAAFGAGAAHAANAFFHNDKDDAQPVKPVEDDEEEEEQEQQHEQEQHEQEQHEQHSNNAHSNNAHSNNGGSHTNNHVTNNHPVQQEEHPIQSHEAIEPAHPTFYNGREVSIERIESVVDDETGEVIHVAYGTVDGHCAILVDDGNGNIQVGVVDYNDNGNPDETEIIDFEGSGVSMSNLAEHMTQDAEIIVEIDDPVITTGGGGEEEHEVEVIAVEHDVEMNGDLVDVAIIEVGETQAVLVDADQDGMADVMAADLDHSGNLDESEVIDIEGEGFIMPTEADVMGSASYASIDNEGPDYINDGSVDSLA